MEAKKQLTGYPSIDKPWLKYYEPGAYERATVISNLLGGTDTFNGNGIDKFENGKVHIFQVGRRH